MLDRLIPSMKKENVGELNYLEKDTKKNSLNHKNNAKKDYLKRSNKFNIKLSDKLIIKNGSLKVYLIILFFIVFISWFQQIYTSNKLELRSLLLIIILF